MTDTTYKPKKGIAYREIQGEMVLVDPSENKLLRLNETASFIWRRLEESPLGAIVQELTESFEVSEERAQEDVKQFTSILLEKHLIVEVEM